MGSYAIKTFITQHTFGGNTPASVCFKCANKTTIHSTQSWKILDLLNCSVQSHYPPKTATAALRVTLMYS